MSLPALTRHDPEESRLRQEIQLACFRLGAEMYAIDIMRIKEIIRPQKLTAVPRAPVFVEGMINLRGTVLPVIDLGKRFGLPATPIDRRSRVVICAVFDRFVGILVEEVSEVRRYTRQEIKAPPEFVKGRESEFFLAVCQREDDLVMVIDLEKLFSTDEILHLSQLQ
ncbi:MAG: chemotaxis protein CheW [Trichloromonas sp.]|jgi:purine-binding chemotaxis protein CheW|nr:chemotaxis protein CheW [Trichloromonas sp.]